MAESIDPGSPIKREGSQNSGPDAEQQPKALEELLPALKAQIETERAQIEDLKKQGRDVRAALKEEADLAWDEVERVLAQIDEAKDLAGSRKDEISGWKLWYNGLPEIDKTEPRKKLEFEVSWRSKEIDEMEKKIVGLNNDMLAAREKLERAKMKLAAYEEGVHERPMEEDPRLAKLSEVREWVEADQKAELRR